MIVTTPHEYRVARALRGDAWQTAIEVAAVAAVAQRTARHHLERLARRGIAERVERFDGYLYRLAVPPERIAAAADIFDR